MNAPGPNSDDWETPDWLFRALDTEFGFTFDAAASKENSKCRLFCADIAKEAERLRYSRFRIFCNPPYSKIELFINVALQASTNLWVFLLPARTDNDWFRGLIEAGDVELRWFRKRVAFVQDGQEQDSPRFPSLIAILK